MAVASLAVSVALIIISGGISHYLNYLTQVVDNGGSDIEVSLNRRLELDETTSDGLKEVDDAYRALATVDGATGEGYMLLDDAYRALATVDGATGEGYMLLTSLCASFEPGMIDYGELSSQSDHYDMPDRGMTDDGTVYAPASVLFLDDASWNQILEENGLDRKRFGDPKNPV